MKKWKQAILTGGIALSLLLSACTVGGNDTKNTTAGNGETQAGTVDNSAGDSSLKGQNVRVVIGSTSTSGDSYMIAETVTRYLSQEMGFNGKVDAIGNAAALDVISKADGDGKTVMMFHDMTFMSILFGSVDPIYSLENMTVGPRIGQNPGGCFGASTSKPYSSLQEVTQYMIDNPDEEVSFNIEAGGASHLAFVAYYDDVVKEHGQKVADQIRVIVGGSTAEKLQRLWDGNADVIYGDTSSFSQYTSDEVDAQLQMTMFGSGDHVKGVEVTSMADEGVQYNGEPFVFPKDFAMYFPKDMDAAVLQEYADAMAKVTTNPDFIADMNALYYTALTEEEVGLEASQEFIFKKRDTVAAIIEGAPNLDDLTA